MTDFSLLKTDFPNYFSLFNLPRKFNIDTDLLQKNYFKLQREFHPDRHILAEESEKKLALLYTTYINKAFETLHSPLRRAIYILNLIGIQIDGEKTLPNSHEVLLEQIEYRETLEIAIKDNDILKLQKLKQDIRIQITKCEKKITKLCDEKSMSLSPHIIQRWLFLEKILEELNKFVIDI